METLTSGKCKVTLLGDRYYNYAEIRSIFWDVTQSRITIVGRASFVGLERKDIQVDHFDMNGSMRITKIEFLSE